jgi:hypothetical protein
MLGMFLADHLHAFLHPRPKEGMPFGSLVLHQLGVSTSQRACVRKAVYEVLKARNLYPLTTESFPSKLSVIVTFPV